MVPISRRPAAAAVLAFVLPFAAVAAFAGPPSPAPAKFVRAVWGHPGQFGTDRDAAVAKMRQVLDGYVKAGIDTVIMCVKTTSGAVYYRSAAAVMDPAWSWDFFDEFHREARARRIDVHPWFCVFTESSLLGAVRQHPEWLIRNKDGEIRAAVNPALPEVRAYERGLMLELVKRYPDLGWVHLDYIRFPCDPVEPYFSLDPATFKLFQAHSGVDLAAVKAHDSGNMIWNEWLEWNRDQVTTFVRELRDGLKAEGRPGVKISAAVFPDAVDAAVLIGQDWAGWAREGLVDMLCPMLYTNHAEYFRKFSARAVEAGRGHCPVCLGIGIGTSHNQNTPEGMAAQMAVARELGADGVVFFSGGSLTPPFMEKLETIGR